MTTPPGSRRHLDRAIALGMFAGCAITAFAFVAAAARPWSMVFWPGAAFVGLLAALAVSGAMGLAASVAQLRRPRDRTTVAGLARYLTCALVLVAIPWFVWVQPFKALWLLMYAGVVTGLVSGAWRILPRLSCLLSVRVAHAAELVAFNLAVLVLLAEFALRVVSAVHPSPAFTVGETPSDVFARYCKSPGELHLGFPCDERGFHDRLVCAPDTRLVACVGDSFSFGLVPHALHYTTLAERALERTELYNAGLIAAGPLEYLRIIREDLLPLRPDALVIALFLGNDVADAWRFSSRWPMLARIFDREHLMLAVLPQRLATLARESTGHAEGGGSPTGGAIQGEDGRPAVPLAGQSDLAGLLAHFPWLDDPAAEAASMTPETFLSVERRRAALVCGPDSEEAYARFFTALTALLDAASGVPVACLLIPDEFQVEDELWSKVTVEGFERDRPQRLIGAWLTAREIPFVDLLPAMRATPLLADGRRHLYHLRDTHWNRRGNALAGEALARFLEEWLPR